MLTCDCGYSWDGGFYYVPDTDFSISRAEGKCLSCKKKINIGDSCLKFETYEPINEDDYNEMSDEEYDDLIGEDKLTGTYYMCEWCGGIYLNLESLGFCLYVFSTTMKEYLKEYWKMTGFVPKQSRPSSFAKSGQLIA